MTGEHIGTDGAADLVEELRSAGADTTRVVAVLWTWLDRHLLELGSLREKLPRIRRLVVDGERHFEGVDEALLQWVGKAPLRNAAELLARIDLTLGAPADGLMIPSTGFGGAEVIVAWRRSDLVQLADESEHAPTESEHPSLTTLAPSLIVCPRTAGGVELIPRRLEGVEGEFVRSSLEDALHGDPPAIEVHLDTLGAAGLPVSWDIDNQHELAALVREMEGKQDEMVAAFGEAVDAAKGQSRILLLPELVASDETLGGLRETLAGLDGEGPVLTVVGRYHRVGDDDGDEVGPELLGDSETGLYVNEAVVLGPLGNELWTHRKFSSAGAKVPTEDGGRYLVEDIRLGRSLTAVETPLGIVAVPICLDTFSAHGRTRLERSPANVLLVPSLSPSVERHRSSLRLLVGVLSGLAFVCNRWIEPIDGGVANWDSEENRSFWVVRGSDEIIASASDGSRPSFVFTL